MTKKEIMVRLNQITQGYGFIYVIAAIAIRDFTGPVNGQSKGDDSTWLTYNEAAFLVRLWIKNYKEKSPENVKIESVFLETYSLMEQLHSSFFFEDMPKINTENPSEFLVSGPRFKEAFFYSATSGYDLQYVDAAIKKYKYDDDWIEKNKGFSIKILPQYFKYIKGILQRNLNEAKGPNGIPKDKLRDVFCITGDEIKQGGDKFLTITLCFTTDLEMGYTNEIIDVGDFNEFQTKPIVKISNDKFFIPLPFFLGEAIYESPFYWMTSDGQYTQKCLENRGNVAEEIVSSLFANVFGDVNTFRAVKIKKRNSTIMSDIDVVAIFDKTAIVVQVKSKKLTALSKKGDIDKIKDDFDKAVESAFLQGVVCKKCIENHDDYSFTDNNKIDISDRIKTIESTYIVCVVLDGYPAITALSHSLLYEKYTESTICFTALDLEIICKILSKPAQLSDYIIKRINNCRYYHADNELCYLGFYLEHDLKKLSEYDYALIDRDYGAKVDQIYYNELSEYKKLVNPKSKKIGRNDKCPCGSNLKYKNCHGKIR